MNWKTFLGVCMLSLLAIAGAQASGTKSADQVVAAQALQVEDL